MAEPITTDDVCVVVDNKMLLDEIRRLRDIYVERTDPKGGYMRRRDKMRLGELWITMVFVLSAIGLNMGIMGAAIMIAMSAYIYKYKKV